MNVDSGGVISSAYPPSFSTKEEKWNAVVGSMHYYGHHDGANNKHHGNRDRVNPNAAVPCFPQNNAEALRSSTIGTIHNNDPELTSGSVVPNALPHNNTGFGSYFFNPLLGLFATNYYPSNNNTNADIIDRRIVQSCSTKTTATAPSLVSPEYPYREAMSPTPMAFMTPSQGPTPCTTPDLPLFHDSHSNPHHDDSAGIISKNHSILQHDKDFYTPSAKRGARRKTVPATTSTSFARGAVGSAIGTVAGYVNQSVLLGIPFHIADHAMKESKESYAKWWQGGIGNKRKCRDKTIKEASQTEAKRRRFASSESASRVGSNLTASLTNRYDDELLEIFGIGQDRKLSATSSSPLTAVVVDSSIIKRRRGVDERMKSPYGIHESSIKPPQSNNCYSAFNDIGGMYDFAGGDSSNLHINHGGHDVDADKAFSTNSVPIINDDAYKENQKTQSTNSATAKPWRNLNGTMQIIGELIEEKNRLSEENELFQMVASPRDWVKKSIRSELIDALGSGKGDVHDKRFLSVLEILSNFYKTSGRDARVSPWSGSGFDGGKHGYNGGETGGPTASDFFEGNWVNMSRPNYIECLGENGDNDFMYTLGRMSFDMFQPSNLICSVQSTHTTIKIIGEREELPAFVPKSLKEEVASLCDLDSSDGTSNRPLLRSYDIAISLTVEPPSSVGQSETPGTPTPTKRMRAVMSVKGYVLPDRDTPNRLSVWFTHGQLAPAKLASNDESETINTDDSGFNHANGQKSDVESDGYGGFEEWSAMFAKGKWRKTMGQRARAMAAKLLLGAELPNKMDEDGHMKYVLHRPVGGHGKVYVDVLYLDEDILVMRGHHGTVYAMARSCVSQRYACGKF